MNSAAPAASGNFAGRSFFGQLVANGQTFILSNTATDPSDNDSATNDASLILQPSSNIFVSSTWTGDSPNTVVTDPTLTDGQSATFGVNAFATIQDAFTNFQSGITTAVIINPGTYATATMSQSLSVPRERSLPGRLGFDGNRRFLR